MSELRNYELSTTRNEVMPISNKEVSAVPGMIVTFKLHDHESNEDETYHLKLVERAKTFEGEISLDSPIGKSIHKAFVGDSIDYFINSNKFTVTILKIEDNK